MIIVLNEREYTATATTKHTHKKVECIKMLEGSEKTTSSSSYGAEPGPGKVHSTHVRHLCIIFCNTIFHVFCNTLASGRNLAD